MHWRKKPAREPDDHTPDGRGFLPMERIVDYVANRCDPFRMKKGVVDPWYPVNKWDTLPRSLVKYSPEAEWFLWIARIVDHM